MLKCVSYKVSYGTAKYHAAPQFYKFKKNISGRQRIIIDWKVRSTHTQINHYWAGSLSYCVSNSRFHVKQSGMKTYTQKRGIGKMIGRKVT